MRASKDRKKTKVTKKIVINKSKPKVRAIPVIPTPVVTPVVAPKTTVKRRTNETVKTEFLEFRGSAEAQIQALKDRLAVLEDNTRLDFSNDNNVIDEVTKTVFHVTETISELSSKLSEIETKVVKMGERIEELTSQRNAAILDNAELRQKLRNLKQSVTFD